MKEEIQRISKLVAEGKLSPEDAADLIEAFYSNETGVPKPPEPPKEAPQAEPEATTEAPKSAPKDAFGAFFESIEKAVREGKESVNWEEVGKQAKTAAKQSINKLKGAIEDVSKGKVNLNLDFLKTQATREVSLPLNLTEGKTLKIENPNGDIKVVGGFDAGSVKADARFQGANNEDAKAKADAYTLIVEESDHQILIRQPDVVGLSVDLEIQVPTGIYVEIKAESGDIEVIGTKAGGRITSRSGDVKLRGLDGLIELSAESGDVLVQECNALSLTIENKSGDITIQRVSGNLSARTASGDVVVESSTGKVTSVESVSGNVRVDQEQPVTGSLNIRTVNGHASVAVPDGSDCRVSLSTLKGSVLCTLELQDEARAEQRVTGRLGTGMGTMDVSAVTGSISLEMHDSVVQP